MLFRLQIKHTKTGMEAVVKATPIPDHKVGIQLVLDALMDKGHGVLSSLDELSAVGHRVVHAGEKFSISVKLDPQVMAALRECIPLAPLHNPSNIMGIEAVTEVLPSVPQVAVFDTAFHQTMPEHAYIYGLPYGYYEKYKVRRYGFHGTSHYYVSRRAAEITFPLISISIKENYQILVVPATDLTPLSFFLFFTNKKSYAHRLIE